ncbi:MAG TPA: sugar transferase [Candidatus Acidoferrum sp.]|jgi:lipopolysaccharide/colanic/teichoic acid biosynthesis glycosyltransferase|nr:sugar transferase [Candidatus Acidoferrum sp.]
MNIHTLNPYSERFGQIAVARTTLERQWLNWSVLWRRWFLRWLAGNGERMKRAFDIVGSSAFLLVFSPLYLVLALVVKLEDRGPVFFGQTRVGRFGEKLQMHKFRSMRLNAEAEFEKLLAQNENAEGVTFKMKNDPRITRVGKWLRRFSLDELPQFFDVLKGKMSLVGPRPSTPREVALYSPADRRRLAVKPGITCFWQVSGRSNIDFSGQVKLDVQYIEAAGLWVDLKILIRTVRAVVAGNGAS